MKKKYHTGQGHGIYNNSFFNSKTYLKMKKYIYVTIAACAVLLFSLQSCKKDEKVDIENNQSNGLNDAFTVKNGFLAFNSSASFKKTIDYIANLNDDERAIWEKKYGFFSQRRIINTIIKDELKQDSINERNYLANKDKPISEFNEHSKSYNSALSKGVIKILDAGTKDEYWDYSIYNRGYVDFINEDGLFAIGDTIFQVTSSSLKAMKTNDFSDTQLLMKATAPDENNHIFFIHEESKLKGLSPGYIQMSNWVYHDPWKMIIGINLSVYQMISGGPNGQAVGMSFFHDVYIQCQKRNWNGSYRYEWADLTVTGSWGISVFYYPQYYGNNWTWSGQAGYLKASINPVTGISAPYQAVFGVTANTQNQALEWYNGSQADYQPIFTRYNWTSTWGSLGLTANLTK